MDILAELTREALNEAEKETLKAVDFSIIEKIDNYRIEDQDLEFSEALAIYFKKNSEALEGEAFSTETNLRMLHRAFKLGYMRGTQEA